MPELAALMEGAETHILVKMLDYSDDFLSGYQLPYDMPGRPTVKESRRLTQRRGGPQYATKPKSVRA